MSFLKGHFWSVTLGRCTSFLEKGKLSRFLKGIMIHFFLKFLYAKHGQMNHLKSLDILISLETCNI